MEAETEAELETKAESNPRAKKLRDTFEKWDRDGNGYITKTELHAVISRLLPDGGSLTMQDVEHLMLEADRNRNGRIEYDEFVEWLMRTGSSISVSGRTNELEFFDLSKTLQPLFQVWDRNGDSTISPEEFEECHNILQTAVRLHETDPALLLDHAQVEFSNADHNSDNRVTFEEFVLWQRRAMERSGLRNDDLEELVPALARQLKRVFRLSDLHQEDALSPVDHKVLLHITQNVASFARDLYDRDEQARNSLKGRQARHFTNRWSVPPAGISIDRLKGKYLKLHTVPTWGVESVELEVLCVPAPAAERGRSRRWLARIVRYVLFKPKGQNTTGRLETDDPFYFVYESMVWSELQATHEFDDAYELLPPELRFFSVLKVEANFGNELPWDAVQRAFGTSVRLGLLADDDVRQYNASFSRFVFGALREDGVMQDFDGSTEQEEEMQRYRARSSVAPQHVMSMLSELGTFRMSSVLADIL